MDCTALSLFLFIVFYCLNLNSLKFFLFIHNQELLENNVAVLCRVTLKTLESLNLAWRLSTVSGVAHKAADQSKTLSSPIPCGSASLGPVQIRQESVKCQRWASGLHGSPPVHLIAYMPSIWPAPVRRAYNLAD